MTRKEFGKNFLTLCAKGNPREAFKLYVSETFKHHNAFFPGDANSLMIAMEESSKENPNRIFEIKHILEDGNLIAFHSYIKQTQNDFGMAVVHILKFANSNKIIELWDLAQQIPENTINENGMF